MLQQVVEAYGCSLVEGVLSHQLKQFVIDGNKCVLSKVGIPSKPCCALEIFGELHTPPVQYGPWLCSDTASVSVIPHAISKVEWWRRNCPLDMMLGFEAARGCWMSVS